MKKESSTLRIAIRWTSVLMVLAGIFLLQVTPANAVTVSYGGNNRTYSGTGTWTGNLSYYDANCSPAGNVYRNYFDSDGVMTFTGKWSGWSVAYGLYPLTEPGFYSYKPNIQYNFRRGTTDFRGKLDYSYPRMHLNIDAGAIFKTTVNDWILDNDWSSPFVFGKGMFQIYRDGTTDWYNLNDSRQFDRYFTNNLTYFEGIVAVGNNIRLGVSNAYGNEARFYDKNVGGSSWTLGVVAGGQLFVGYNSNTTTITRNLYLEGTGWAAEGAINGALRFGGGATTVTGNITIGSGGAMIFADGPGSAATLGGSIVGGTARFSKGGTADYTYTMSGGNIGHSSAFNVDSGVTLKFTGGGVTLSGQMDGAGKLQFSGNGAYAFAGVHDYGIANIQVDSGATLQFKNHASLDANIQGAGSITIENNSRVYTRSTKQWVIGAADVKAGSQLLLHNATTYSIGTLTLRSESGYTESQTLIDGTNTWGALRVGNQLGGGTIKLIGDIEVADNAKMGISNATNVELNGAVRGNKNLTILVVADGKLNLNGATTVSNIKLVSGNNSQTSLFIGGTGFTSTLDVNGATVDVGIDVGGGKFTGAGVLNETRGGTDIALASFGNLEGFTGTVNVNVANTRLWAQTACAVSPDATPFVSDGNYTIHLGESTQLMLLTPKSSGGSNVTFEVTGNGYFENNGAIRLHNYGGATFDADTQTFTPNSGVSTISLLESKVKLSSDAIVTVDSVAAFSGVFSGSKALTLRKGTAILLAANTFTGKTTINEGAILQLGYNGEINGVDYSSWTGSLASSEIVDNGKLIVANSAATTLDALISGSGSVESHMTGTTRLTLSNLNNSFAGGVKVFGGILRFSTALNTTGNVTSLGAADATITMKDGTQLHAYSSADNDGNPGDYIQTLAQSVNIDGTASVRAGHKVFLNLGGAVTADTLNIASDSGYVALGNSGNSFSKLNIGSGLEDWEDAASAAHVFLTADNALGNALVEFSMNYNATGGNYLAMNGHSASISGLKANIDNGPYAVVKNASEGAASTLTINTADGQSYDYYGTLTDGGSAALNLVKAGTGTQVLYGLNDYSGTTDIQAGVLKLDTEGQITTSAYSIAAGAQLIYDNTVDVTAGNFFDTGTGEIFKENENTLLLNGTEKNNFAGNIYVHGGTLQVASSFAEACGYVDGCTLELLENGELKNLTLTKGNVIVDGGTVNDTLTINDSSTLDDPSAILAGSVNKVEMQDGTLEVEGGTITTVNQDAGTVTASDESTVAITDYNLNDGTLDMQNGTIGTLTQEDGTSEISGGTVENASIADGEMTISGGQITDTLTQTNGDVEISDGSVGTLTQTGGTSEIAGGTVENASVANGELEVSGGQITDTLTQTSGDVTVSDGSVGTLEQSGGAAQISGGEVTAANLSDGELTVAEDGEVGTLTQTGGDSYITGGEVELANLSDGNLSVSDYGAVTTLNQSGGKSEISGGEVETANLSDGVLTVSEDGEVSMLSQTGGDSFITGGKVEEAELSGNTLTLSDDGELGTLTQTAGKANITGGKVKDSIYLSGDDSELNISGGKVNDVYQEAGTTNVTGGKVTGDFSISGDNSVLNISDDGNVSYVSQESGTTNISGDSTVGVLIQDAGVTTISGGTTDSIEIVDGTLTMTDGVVESLMQDDGTMTISGGEVTEFYQLGGTTEIKDDAVVYSGMLYGGDTQMTGGTAGEMKLLAWDEATEGNLTVENAEILDLYQENGTATVKDSTLGTVSLLGGELTIEDGVVEDTLTVTDGLSEWDGSKLTGGNLTLLKDNEVSNLVVDAGDVVIAGSTIDVLDISGGRVTTDDVMDEILDNITIGDVSMDGGYLSLVEVDDVGSLSLNRRATLEILLKDEMDVAAVTADKVDLNGGSLVVNLQPDQTLHVGDTYKLFSAENGITGSAVGDLSKLAQLIIKDAEGTTLMTLDSGILPSVLRVTDNNTVLQFYVDPNIVPEPGTWMLLALGLLGLGAVSRRKRAKAA